LDGFLARHYPHARCFTAEQFTAWTAQLRSLTPTGVRAHQRCIRQFCRYLAPLQPATFVPDPSTFPKPWPTKLPCLLSPLQVGHLLAATRCLEPSAHDPLQAQSMRLALIFMFCCGLCRREVRRLHLADLDLKQQVLHIHESKFHKSRLVPLAPSVAQELQTYLRQRARHQLPIEPTAPFLWNGRTNHTSGPLGPSAVASRWHRICREAQIFDSRGHPPRLHDLRHSFAVEVLRRGYAAGRDAQATLPRLARSLGHACPAFTHRYLKFTEPIRLAASVRFYHAVARILRPVMQPRTPKGGAA
jgi:integrase